MTMAVLTMRQVLAEQLASYIRKRGGWAISPLPLKDSDHLRFEVRLSDDTLLHDLKRLGFELRLLSQLTRVDAWAVTELIPVGNTHRLRRHPGIVDICVYEVELPEVELPEIAEPSELI
jgi:hypothetical protein